MEVVLNHLRLLTIILVLLLHQLLFLKKQKVSKNITTGLQLSEIKKFQLDNIWIFMLEPEKKMRQSVKIRNPC